MNRASNDIQETLNSATEGGGTKGAHAALSGLALAGEALLTPRSNATRTPSTGANQTSTTHSTTVDAKPSNISSRDNHNHVYSRDNENNETYSLYNLCQQQQQQLLLNNNSDRGCSDSGLSGDGGGDRLEPCLSGLQSPPPYRVGREARQEELHADSVDLLKMLPEAQRCRPERHHATCGGSLKLARVTIPESHEVERLYQPCLEDHQPETAYSDIYNALHAAPMNSGRMTPVSFTDGVPGQVIGQSSCPDDRITYYTMPHGACPLAGNSSTSDFHPIYESRQNNQTNTLNTDYRNMRPSGIAQYCTSKVHSRSCGNLTCPKFDSKRSDRLKGQGCTSEQRKRQRRRIERCKKWAFLIVIFIGILLAVTGIIVGFMVVAPFKYKAGRCETGRVFCEGLGCLTTQKLCLSGMSCPGINSNALCANYNVSDFSIYGTKDKPLVVGEDVTLGPKSLNTQDISKDDVMAWVHFIDDHGRNGSRYFTINKALTFQAAQEQCRNNGGHLVHINSMREQIFVEDYLRWVIEIRGVSRDLLGYWLGARRDRGSHSGSCMYDQWKWVDAYRHIHGTVNGFTAFAPGKPDNFYGPEECLYASTNHDVQNSYLKWDDAPCDIQGIGTIRAICEVEPKQLKEDRKTSRHKEGIT